MSLEEQSWGKGVGRGMGRTDELSFEGKLRTAGGEPTSPLLVSSEPLQPGFSLTSNNCNSFTKVTNALFITKTLFFSVLIVPDLRKPSSLSKA